MPGQTEWETEREREEFGRAAKLYKPLAGMMAMRFTTGKQQDDSNQVDVKVEENVGYLFSFKIKCFHRKIEIFFLFLRRILTYK